MQVKTKVGVAGKIGVKAGTKAFFGYVKSIQ